MGSESGAWDVIGIQLMGPANWRGCDMRLSMDDFYIHCAGG